MALSQIETASLSSALVAPTATALTTASGSAPSYSARAWVNFNGAGTVAIRASGNCSSVTDNGVGDYTVNFATAMVDANYSVSVGGATSSATTCQVSAASSGSSPTLQSTTAVKVTHIASTGGTAIDCANMYISIFR